MLYGKKKIYTKLTFEEIANSILEPTDLINQNDKIELMEQLIRTDNDKFLDQGKYTLKLLNQYKMDNKNNHIVDIVKEVKQNIYNTKLFIATDVEADDFLALIMIIEHFIKFKISFKNLIIYTCLGNANKKKLIVEKLLESYNIKDKVVYAGINGLKETYKEEGVNILNEAEQKIKECEPEKIPSLKNCRVDFLILMNPLGVLNILEEYVAGDKIEKIYVMGGYFKEKCTYNWSIDLRATEKFLNLITSYKIKTIVYSSHMFAENYNGYYNKDKHPEIIKEIFENNNKKSILLFKEMVKNWDNYVTSNGTDEEMVKRIGKEHIGKQFAPADVVCAVGYITASAIEEERKDVHYWINLFNLDKNIKITYYDYSKFNIIEVKKLNIPFINKIILSYIKN